MKSLRAISGNATNSSTYFSTDTSKASSKQEKTATFGVIKLKVKQTEQLQARSLNSGVASSVQQTKPLFTNLLSEKVRDFNGVIGNHKDKTEKRLWEFGKRRFKFQ